MKIVCIGNSIVNGFPHKRSQSWPSLLREKTGYKVINKGINGDETKNIMARFDKDVISHNPEIAMVLTGTNDFIYEDSMPETVMDNLATLAVKCKNNKIRPVLLTPLLTDAETAKVQWKPADYNRINDKLKDLAQLMKNYGKANDVIVIDLQAEYKGRYTDGVHPDTEGQESIADIILSVLKK